MYEMNRKYGFGPVRLRRYSSTQPVWVAYFPVWSIFAGRSANGLRGERIPELYTLSRHAVQMRRQRQLLAIAADRVPPLLVAEEYNDIGAINVRDSGGDGHRFQGNAAPAMKATKNRPTRRRVATVFMMMLLRSTFLRPQSTSQP